MEYKLKFKYVNGYPLYLVPKVKKGDTVGPRSPKSVGGTYLYPVNKPNHVVVVAGKGANNYYSKRKYAEFIGTAIYSSNGYGHHDFVV